MKALKILAALAFAYVVLVVAFESFFGFFQPSVGPILVITTFDRDGNPHDRVLSRLASGGHLYVAANHWPRAWYRRALANSRVQITLDGDKREYRAVPVIGEEHHRVSGEHTIPLVPRILSGFAPRYFLRLDPHAAPSGRGAGLQGRSSFGGQLVAGSRPTSCCS